MNGTPAVEILQQHGHHFLWIGDYLWMWDIPEERKAQKYLSDQCYGNVLVAGYGLGLVQQCLTENPEVKSVLSVEINSQVLTECKRVYGRLFGETVAGDFYQHTSNFKYDCVFGDIWQDIIPESLKTYNRFKAKALPLLKPGGKVVAWGQELFEYLNGKNGND